MLKAFLLLFALLNVVSYVVSECVYYDFEQFKPQLNSPMFELLPGGSIVRNESNGNEFLHANGDCAARIDGSRLPNMANAKNFTFGAKVMLLKYPELTGTGLYQQYGDARFLSSSNQPSTDRLQLGLSYRNYRARIRTDRDNGKTFTAQSGTVMPLNEWVWLSVIFDDDPLDRLAVYANGNLVAENDNVNGDMITIEDRYLYFGCHGQQLPEESLRRAYAYIDDVFICNTMNDDYLRGITSAPSPFPTPSPTPRGPTVAPTQAPAANSTPSTTTQATGSADNIKQVVENETNTMLLVAVIVLVSNVSL